MRFKIHSGRLLIAGRDLQRLIRVPFWLWEE
ncbi:hypothetical protein predicted by Glimmer/Critica [Acetobacter senegalensis]|uniref:Uncharacterized protein n=1 Tax=Acetobacter senegalensis TaxID=446692 RepID=A0A0U5ERG1_9PROT|nr:hypothetical protein predicted by Glimmer/Critica [Acetobacter senegalensis]